MIWHTIYVLYFLNAGSLDTSVTDRDLREYFKKFGHVDSANIIYNKDDSHSGSGVVILGNGVWRQYDLRYIIWFVIFSRLIKCAFQIWSISLVVFLRITLFSIAVSKNRWIMFSENFFISFKQIDRLQWFCCLNLIECMSHHYIFSPGDLVGLFCAWYQGSPMMLNVLWLRRCTLLPKEVHQWKSSMFWVSPPVFVYNFFQLVPHFC